MRSDSARLYAAITAARNIRGCSVKSPDLGLIARRVPGSQNRELLQIRVMSKRFLSVSRSVSWLLRVGIGGIACVVCLGSSSAERTPAGAQILVLRDHSLVKLGPNGALARGKAHSFRKLVPEEFSLVDFVWADYAQGRLFVRSKTDTGWPLTGRWAITAMNLAATEQLLHVPDGMAVGFAITDRVYLRTEIRNAPDDSGEDGLGSNDVIGSALYDRKTLRELVRFADRTGYSPDVLHDCFEPERFAVIDAHGSHLDARSLAPLGLARLRGRFSVTRECFSSEGALLTMAPIQEKSEPEKRRQPFYEQS